ncbi:MAG: PilN domain-containing protein [Candidatus Methylomirabilales bacterium]
MLIRGFNLAAADYRRARRQGRLAAAVAALLAALLLAQGGYWLLLRREAAEAGARLGAMEAQRRDHEARLRAARGGLPGDAAKGYEAKVAALNRILEASAFSWTGLLFELERAVPPEVELREIHPDPSTGKVSLAGAAKSEEAVSRLVRGLGQRPAFRDVYLLREAERQVPASAGRPARREVSFSLNLVYSGGTP